MFTSAIPGKESKLFTIAAQDSTDLIIVGPATAAGSYLGVFVKADVTTNNYLGEYQNHRKDQSPIRDHSDFLSHGNAMAIEVRGVCYELDSSEGDCRSAWFVDEAPTAVEGNYIFIIRKSNQKHPTLESASDSIWT
jgi:hypothetical protein